MSRSGGTRKRNHEVHQDVMTHPVNALEIMQHIKSHISGFNKPKILDACCGLCALGNAIINTINNYKKIDWVDINSYGQENVIIQDVRTIKQTYDIIVCNPPFHPVTVPESIYHHLISILNDRGVLIFLIDNTFLYQGKKRAIELRFQKTYFLPRYTFLPAGKPLLDISINIYHKGIFLNSAMANDKIFIDLTKIKEF